MDAAKIYDKMAGSYQNLSTGRFAYLRAVTDIIPKHSLDPLQYLDVGCGDGDRTVEIAAIVGALWVEAIDISSEMAKIAESKMDKFECTSMKNYFSVYSYDLITALWNVLGHIKEADRLESLKNMEMHLTTDGLFIFDVNNRYNLGYGFWNVVKNIIFRRSGWHTFKFKGEEFPTYLYSPREIKGLLKKAGLEIVKKYGVDYETGKVSKSLFRGQMVFVVRRK